MSDILIEETSETPKIDFNLSKGHLLLKGKSIPENPNEFYEPLFNAINTYSENPLSHTTLDFKLEYFNTSSSKIILEILKKFQIIDNNEKTVSINWYYDIEDDEILEIGEDYSKILNIPLNLVAIQN